MLSRITIMAGLFMLSCLIPSLFYDIKDLLPILSSSLITIFSGLSVFYMTRKINLSLNKREGFLIVALAWIVISLFGSLPFIISGAIPSFTDAFFETMSGFSTTGATILTDIESLPESLLIWRSMTQWIGGMGIIVLTIAIIPYLGIGGMQMFVAEVPGITPDKLHPRIRVTAARLWIIYCVFTLAEFILLKAGGMSSFDAINHSFTTMATGGYSTKNASIAAFDSSYIHIVITVFMFLAGTSFTLSYFAIAKGNFKKAFTDHEFRFYVLIILLAGFAVASILFFKKGYPLGIALRDSFFQVVSIITTTGYCSNDYETWTFIGKFTFFVLLFVGGCAGSTGGGIKVIRHRLLLLNVVAEFKRLIHPRAIIPVRHNHKGVSPDIISYVLAFFYIYILIFIIGTFVMLANGLDFETAIGSVASCLANVGPGIGDVGPSGNYAAIPDFGKWFLSLLMLTGRLELFTVLMLFTRIFWK